MRRLLSFLCLSFAAAHAFAGLPPHMARTLGPMEHIEMEMDGLYQHAQASPELAPVLAALRAPGEAPDLWAGGTQALCRFLRASLLLYVQEQAARPRLEALFARMLQDRSLDWNAPTTGDNADLHSPLGLVLYFAERHPVCAAPALEVVRRADFDVHARPGNYSLPAWAICADSPEMLAEFIRRGADLRHTACELNFRTLNCFGLLQETHSSRMLIQATSNNAIMPQLHASMSQRPRTRGLELAKLLDAHGCPLYIRHGETEFTLSELRELSVIHGRFAPQPCWPELRDFLQHREEEERRRATERLGTPPANALPLMYRAL